MKKLDWNKMREQIKNQEKSGGFEKKVDERIYMPKYREDGTFEALIRFLPSPDTDIPYVKKYSHGFKGISGWYIEDCPTTHGEECPVCKANSALWNAGDEDTPKRRARRLSVYANILIVKDPQTPENEGKVFLYRYGKKIHEKIMDTINPPEDSIDDPIMVFDPEGGANFKLKIKKIKVNDKAMPNYDQSKFCEPSALKDSVIKKIEKKLFNLSGEVDIKSFKTYDELEQRFKKVVGDTDINTTSEPKKEEDSMDDLTDMSNDSTDDDFTSNMDVDDTTGEKSDNSDAESFFSSLDDE